MTPDQGRALLLALGAKRIQKNGRWVQASCPLAPKTHQRNHDLNPSFGILCEPSKPARWNCFACGSGRLIDLVQQMEFYGLSVDSKKAREVIDSESLEVVPLPEYGEFAVPEDQWVFVQWPEQALWGFDPIQNVPVAVQYMEGRGIPLAQSIAEGLMFDHYRQMVVFPLRDAYGRLAGARGRSIDDSTSGPDRHHDYSHEGIPKNVKGVWYGEPDLQLPGPVVVVEGQIDRLKVKQVCSKVVANFTAKPTVWKVQKIATCPHVVLVPDNDPTGELSIELYSRLLFEHNVPLTVVRVHPQVKDPGECHPSYLRDLLEPVINALC